MSQPLEKETVMQAINWKPIFEAYYNELLRVGNIPRIYATTTPRNCHWPKSVLDKFKEVIPLNIAPHQTANGVHASETGICFEVRFNGISTPIELHWDEFTLEVGVNPPAMMFTYVTAEQAPPTPAK